MRGRDATLPREEGGRVGAPQKPWKLRTEAERDDFERELKRKVMSGFHSVFDGSSKEEEESLRKWTEEIPEDRRHVGSERREMEQEDSMSKGAEPHIFFSLLLGVGWTSKT